MARSAALGLLCYLALGAGRVAAQDSTQGQHRHPPADTAFAALQARGAQAMGVDQNTSRHRFTPLEDGGSIELVRLEDDSAGAAQIRRHLRAIATAFSAGDFSAPAFIHLREVPGSRVMAERRDRIAYEVDSLPDGGRLRITTQDPEAIRAVHEFLAFQAMDHRTGDDSAH